MRVLISGATGLVGQVLVRKLLEKNHEVSVLTRDFFKTTFQFPSKVQVYLYHPDVQKKSFDALINLAGEPISQFWTPSVKKKILTSRLKSTEFLLSIQADHLISTSAIGLYPFSYSPQKEESPTTNDHFLAQVCQFWEKEAQKFSKTVSIIRVGLVLSPNGGLVQKLKPLFKWFLGAYLGSGDQGTSWIHVEDLADIYLFLLEKKLPGIFNGVANSTTHKNFFHTFAHLLHRRIFFKVPDVFLKFILKDFSHLFLDSHFIESSSLKKANFHFRYKDLEQALFQCLR